MNLKSLIPLIAAVILGLIALVVARKALTKSGSAEGVDPVISIAVAARDMPPGTELKADDLAVSRVPAESLPSGSFRTTLELAGRTTIQPLVKGQAVIDPLLAPTGAKGGLTGLIPAGMRAMTVEVNEFSGLAGMLQPGARVDVIAVIRDERDDKKQSARTILQNLEVRAVGRNINPAPPIEGAPPPPPSNNVTLLMTPKQAQIMNLASQNGRPWLVLRNNLDKELPESETVTLEGLRNLQAQLEKGNPMTRPSDFPPAMEAVLNASPVFAPAPSRPSARVVQVIRGGVETSVKLETEAAPRPVVATPATKPTRPAPAINGRAFTGLDSEAAPE